MGFSIKASSDDFCQARIKVVGVGGGGCNAVNRLVELGLNGVEIIGINSDRQSLEDCCAPVKVQLGDGLGAGSDPERGRELALESKDRIREVLSDAHMVFVAASMGGGTGTGGAPVVAQIAKEQGSIVVGVITKPSAFEGTYKLEIAERGMELLCREVDSLILISNQKLLNVVDEETLLYDGLMMTSDILVTAVRSVLVPLLVKGMVNVDFADYRTVMSHKGLAIMGIGCASGEDRALKAADKALDCQLLEGVSVEGAKGVLIYIQGKDVKYKEANQAFNYIRERTGQGSFVIWGASKEADGLKDGEMQVIVIATGFDSAMEARKMHTDSAMDHSGQARSYFDRLRTEREQKRRMTPFNGAAEEPQPRVTNVVKVITDPSVDLDEYDLDSFDQVARTGLGSKTTGSKYWKRRPD